MNRLQLAISCFLSWVIPFWLVPAAMFACENRVTFLARCGIC